MKYIPRSCVYLRLFVFSLPIGPAFIPLACFHLGLGHIPLSVDLGGTSSVPILDLVRSLGSTEGWVPCGSLGYSIYLIFVPFLFCFRQILPRSLQDFALPKGASLLGTFLCEVFYREPLPLLAPCLLQSSWRPTQV